MKRVLVIVVTYNGLPWLDRSLGSVTLASSAGPPSPAAGTPSQSAGTPTEATGIAHPAAGAPSQSAGTPTEAAGIAHPAAGTGPNNCRVPSNTAFFAGTGPEIGPLPAIDVYVVDNDSTDGSADFVQSHFPSAKLVRSAENLGFSKANNLGMQYALDHGYDYVYLLNQDAWLEPGAMEKLVAAAEAHPEYAVLSPLQMTDGYISLDKEFAKLVPEDIQFRKQYHPRFRGRGPFMGRGGAAGVLGTVNHPEVVDVKRVMAAHWLVRVDAIRMIGLFNEILFPLYGQDDNWCHRARYMGYRIGIVPQARAVHDRAQRKEDKDRLIFRNYYTGSLVRLANPNVPMWLSYLYILPFTLVKAVRYRSLKVFASFFRLHAQFPAIRTLRSNR